MKQYCLVDEIRFTERTPWAVWKKDLHLRKRQGLFAEVLVG